jgi:DNA invertase Pin-like site-specific DNA recombinase
MMFDSQGAPDKRVAIYLRVSTKDAGQDTDNQRLQIREFCKTQD